MRQGRHQRVEPGSRGAEIEHVADGRLEIEAAVVAQDAEQRVLPRPLLLERVPGDVVAPGIAHQARAGRSACEAGDQAPGQVVADLAGGGKNRLRKSLTKLPPDLCRCRNTNPSVTIIARPASRDRAAAFAAPRSRSARASSPSNSGLGQKIADQVRAWRLSRAHSIHRGSPSCSAPTLRPGASGKASPAQYIQASSLSDDGNVNTDGLREIGREVDVPCDPGGRGQARQQAALRRRLDQFRDELANVRQGAERLAIVDGFSPSAGAKPRRKIACAARCTPTRPPVPAHELSGRAATSVWSRAASYAHGQAAASADQAQLVERRVSRQVEHRRNGSGVRRCRSVSFSTSSIQAANHAPVLLPAFVRCRCSPSARRSP